MRNEIAKFSKFLNTIRENLTSNETSLHVKHDLQKIVAWFITDYFTHNIALIAQARKNCRPQSTNDDTVNAEQSGYVWDPHWSHPLFLKIPVDISSQAISTISIRKDYVKVFPLTTDATPLNYNSFLPGTQNRNEKKNTRRNQSRHQTPYYTSNLFPSDDEEHCNHNHQRFSKRSSKPKISFLQHGSTRYF